MASLSRPSLSKKQQTPSSSSKPTLESSSFANRLQEAFSLLPARRSPTKNSASTNPSTNANANTKPTSPTPARKSPFSFLSSSRHKHAASAPAAVHVTSQNQQQHAASSHKASLTTPSRAAQPPSQSLNEAAGNVNEVDDDVPPPVPPKSAPASRTVMPMWGSHTTGDARTTSAGPSSSNNKDGDSKNGRSRPTIPFIGSSSLLQPTAASNARSRPAATPSSSSNGAAATSSSSHSPFTLSKPSSLSKHKRTLSKSRAPESTATPLSPTLVSSPTESTATATPISTTTTTRNRSRTSPSPTPDATTSARSKSTSPDLKISGPMQLRPRAPVRLPTSPPSAYPVMKPSVPPRSLPRKRSKTFPDPSDPNTALPPFLSTKQLTPITASESEASSSSPTTIVASSPTLATPTGPRAPASQSLTAATRIMEAFEESPRANASPEPAARLPTSPISPGPITSASMRSKSTSPTPVRPIRSPQDSAFMSIPSRARPGAAAPSTIPFENPTNSGSSRRIVPSAASIEAAAARGRLVPKTSISVQSPTRPGHRSSPSEQSLPPPPRNKPMSPTLASSNGSSTTVNSHNNNNASHNSLTGSQSRRGARPALRPIQTAPVGSPISRPTFNRSVTPSSPETQPSSPSPKTPEPTYFTSEDESRSGSAKKRGLRGLWGRKRPDSLVSSSTAISASGTSNGGSYAIRGGGGGERKQKGPGTFGGLPEEEEEFVQHKAMQTRHGIRKHAHPVSEVPYPISYEEVVLQGEKHTQELLSMVLQQKAYHFTPLESFAKLKNVLDIGCGRGYWLMDAAKELKHANLVGFDLVDVFMKPHEMRERKGLNDAQIARIEFVQGNFFNGLPFASERFDFIRIAFLELAIPESKWVPLLKEAWRTLKPGGHIEVIIETLLFPTVWSYDKLPVQSALEGEFKHMLEARDIPPTTNIGEKMFFDAFARVQTHQHVSVCIAPRPAGRSSLDNPASPRNYGSMRSIHSPWSSEPIVRTGVVSPTPYGRPSLDRSRTSFDVLPPAGHLVTSQTCTVPGIVISPDTFIPVSEDNLYTYASHGARILNSTRLATFFDKHPNASEHDAFDDGFEKEWRGHVERYWQYEKNNRNRLGFRNNQFDDEDDEIPIPPPGPSIGRWKWSKCDEDIERPLEIRRFRAWSLTKPISTR